MDSFNRNTRKKNIVRASSAGLICKVTDTLATFIYRVVFIRALSANYLGINGLFTNILGVLSFADLGIAAAITFRFYDPISRNDVTRVGELMRFFRRVYLIIAAVIMVAGLSVMPFLKFFIKDTGEIPSDINLYVIYFLFLLQTAATYTYSYKLTILKADQRNHLTSILETSVNIGCKLIQVIILFLWKNYTMTLAASIITTIGLNMVFSKWTELQYPDVFKVKSSLPQTIKKQIYHDTYASMCHRFGWTILTSTDNIILTKFAGLVMTGLYSNYSIILTALNSFFNQIFGNFTSSLGNAYVTQNKDELHSLYMKMLFANLWASGVCTVCFYVLANDFIMLWLGPNLLLDDLTVAIICVQFFFDSSHIISRSFISGCGIFVDKARPFIQAGINIIVSIILVKKMGVAGVFLGTIISHVLTAFWREPYNLYKLVFKRSSGIFWIRNLETGIITFLMAYGFTLIKKTIVYSVSWGFWLLEAVLCFILSNLFFLIISHRSQEYQYLKDIVTGYAKGFQRKIMDRF